MIPIRIECGCGQKYAFDVEPVNNSMPHTVTCPSCGVDGTQTANVIISQSIGATTTPLTVTATGVRLRAAAPHATAVPDPRNVVGLPQASREQVEHEARAKIFWGDSPQEVIKFLMMNGVSYQEAQAIVAGLSKERSAATRANGVRKILIGIPLMCVPVVAFIIFQRAGFFPVKLFAFAVMIGLYGGYMALTGTMMVIAPKVESGDVADQ